MAEPLSETSKVLRGAAFLVPVLLVAAFASRGWVSTSSTHGRGATVAPRGGETCEKVLEDRGMFSPERCELIALERFEVPVRRLAVGAWIGGVILTITIIWLAVRATRRKRTELRFALGAVLLGASPILAFVLHLGDGIRRAGILAAVACLVAAAASTVAARLPRQPELPPDSAGNHVNVREPRGHTCCSAARHAFVAG